MSVMSAGACHGHRAGSCWETVETTHLKSLPTGQGCWGIIPPAQQLLVEGSWGRGGVVPTPSTPALPCTQRAHNAQMESVERIWMSMWVSACAGIWGYKRSSDPLPWDPCRGARVKHIISGP